MHRTTLQGVAAHSRVATNEAHTTSSVAAAGHRLTARTQAQSVTVNIKFLQGPPPSARSSDPSTLSTPPAPPSAAAASLLVSRGFLDLARVPPREAHNRLRRAAAAARQLQCGARSSYGLLTAPENSPCSGSSAASVPGSADRVKAPHAGSAPRVSPAGGHQHHSPAGWGVVVQPVIGSMSSLSTFGSSARLSDEPSINAIDAPEAAAGVGAAVAFGACWPAAVAADATEVVAGVAWPGLATSAHVSYRPAPRGCVPPAVNVQRLAAFRDRVTRNLAPTIAHGWLEAVMMYRSLHPQQRQDEHEQQQQQCSDDLELAVL